MIININELRERDEPLFVERDFTDGELNLRNQVARLRSPAHAKMRVSLSADRVFVAGTLKADLELACGRCLQPVATTVQKAFELEYWPDPVVESDNEEFALTYTDLSIGFYRDDQLDLSAAVSEQITLDLPMKPVCRESCKGLCDQCGADLNHGSCDCQRETLDPRLAALMDLKKRMTH